MANSGNATALELGDLAVPFRSSAFLVDRSNCPEPALARDEHGPLDEPIAWLRILEGEALNAETPIEYLDQPLTPLPAFFIRNNGRLPEDTLKATENWTLIIDGEVERSSAWTVAELKSAFPAASVIAVLECAGNGRSGFAAPTDGLQWGLGAVGCAKWTGIRLSDLLQAAGLKGTAVYTGHHSPDVALDGSGQPAISRGLPIEKALAPETLVAFEMNDEPLPSLHGGPLRIVAPGYPGAAWQKWLTRISVRDCEHDGPKMTGLDYRLPSVPVAPGDKYDPSHFAVITDMPVRSLITGPKQDFAVEVGQPFEVRGFAWGGHTPVTSVSVSINDGATWTEARLEAAPDRFAWRRFSAELRFHRDGPATVFARATDAAGRSQPLDGAPWNPRGYCNNVVQRVSGLVGSSQ